MSAKDVQIGGDHYKSLAIQPVEYIHANDIGFCEGCAIKYLTRWRDKGGIEDLKKARHFIELLIEFEEREEGTNKPDSDKTVMDSEPLKLPPCCVCGKPFDETFLYLGWCSEECRDGGKK